jgi:hypothetical protein
MIATKKQLLQTLDLLIAPHQKIIDTLDCTSIKDVFKITQAIRTVNMYTSLKQKYV